MQQQVLGGRYLLKDKVGTGGMATVYRAQDQVLNRTVAVKIMLPQYAGDATFAARFKQEAQAAAGLSSPYIVGVYDWGKDGDTYYIVMEYLRGTDLKSGIRSHGALDPKKVAQIGSQICAALSVAHKHEIIHRDIKPQNIMVLPDGNIKVMDFGIARAKNSHLTQDNNVLGTAHYVSPEQTRGQELGPTSDIYSLGVVMYECATGQVPFDGDDAISVALKQVNELPVPPSQLNPNLDADLERIILRCMEKDPANRFQTADELRQTLNAYLAGRQVDVPEPTRVSVVPAGGAGTTETRVMSDQTQAMARPAGIGNTAVRSGSGMSSSASGGADPYGGKKKGGKGKIVAGVVAALAIIGVIAFAAFSALNSGAKTVTVPNVLGYTQEDATEELRSLNLGVKTSSGYSDEYEEGEVMSQTPSGGLQVEEGYEVEIQISRGPEPIKTTTVPDLKGRTREEAEKLLEEAGLVGVASEASNDAEEGTVFEQSPAEGEEVEEGSTVTYTVSTGPGTVSIPNVVGDGENSAAGALEDAGFSVSREYEYSSRVDAGVVISQSLTGSAMPGP
ncbi:Stk1 family PASTA domain-containing Ser/Thr kinase, partial [Enorma massiliensis]|uniref:Stk1 family PASTA domain-containing Ser/Thr kinase n=1 Tax=Enorma massiliensis TaxID=1472761 RepID=UPI003AF042E6